MDNENGHGRGGGPTGWQVKCVSWFRTTRPSRVMTVRPKLRPDGSRMECDEDEIEALREAEAEKDGSRICTCCASVVIREMQSNGLAKASARPVVPSPPTYMGARVNLQRRWGRREMMIRGYTACRS